MSEPPPTRVPRTATTHRRTWFPGWIWAIPLAAVGIVVWLLLRTLSARGFEVTLVLNDAAGMAVKQTQVVFRGLDVGQVSNLALAPDGHHVIAQLDLDESTEPYVRSGSRFYVEGTHPSLANPSSLKALISGPTIELVPGPGRAARHFVAIDRSVPPKLAVTVPYVVTFKGAVGGIEPGSPVTLGGFSVGVVEHAELTTDPHGGHLGTQALIELDPTRFHIQGVEAKPSDWRSVMTSTLAALVANGLRASVTQSPPLIGQLEITLEMESDLPRASLGTVGQYRSIPAAEASGLEAFSRKLGRIPLDQIAANVREITERLKKLSGSPKLADSLRHLDSTLTALDRTVRTAGPEVAPTLRSVRKTVTSLRRTAAQIDATAGAARSLINGSAAPPGGNVQQALKELTDAARSIRALANYLDQHPEALIRGR